MSVRGLSAIILDSFRAKNLSVVYLLDMVGASFEQIITTAYGITICYWSLLIGEALHNIRP